MKIRNIFTLCLTIFPILMTYETPIKGISYGDLILLLLYPFLFYKIISEKRKVKDIVYFPLVILFLYLLVYYLLLAFIDAKLFSETSIKFIHNLFYLFTLSFFVKSFYDIDIGYKVLKVVSIVATFFLFIQIMVEDCPYPFKKLCGAAVAWRLAEALYIEAGISREEFLDFKTKSFVPKHYLPVYRHYYP